MDSNTIFDLCYAKNSVKKDVIFEKFEDLKGFKNGFFGNFSKGLIKRNGLKWPILETNFKHGGVNITYRF